jgi:hypothetical protein
MRATAGLDNCLGRRALSAVHLAQEALHRWDVLLLSVASLGTAVV